MKNKTFKLLLIIAIATISLLIFNSCKPIHQDCVCTEIYMPVCGVDGKTYSNQCFAECAKVAIYKEGECL